MEPYFKMSLDTIIDLMGFVQTGTDKGTPVFELKKEVDENKIDESDELFVDIND